MTPEEWDVPLPIEGLAPPKEKMKRGTSPQAQQDAEAAKVRWTRTKVANPPICNHCISEAQALPGKMPTHALGRSAYTRVEGSTTEFLCFTHTQAQRDADGLEKVRAGV